MLRLSLGITAPFAAAGLLLIATTGDPSLFVMLLATAIATIAMVGVIRAAL